MKDIIAYIIAYEEGDLRDIETIELFSELIKTGQAWTLQGHYGRTAQALINADFIDDKGNINWKLVNNRLGEKEK